MLGIFLSLPLKVSTSRTSAFLCQKEQPGLVSSPDFPAAGCALAGGRSGFLFKSYAMVTVS